jgi:predicted outer membrane repeat protein
MTFPSIPCLRRRAAFGLLALASLHAHAGIALPPTILTVGNTGNCDHATIAAAIAAAPGAGETVIRISNNVAHDDQALLVIDKNIELRGGYPGCDFAPADPDARTTIRGNGVDTVVNVFSNGTPRNVTLRNLVIREGGSNDTLNERGGGVRVGGPMHVEIRNSLVGDNESFLGAGVYIEGGDASLLLDDNTIIGLASGLPGNRAIDAGVIDARGGGISCVSADIEIFDARIRGNTSESDGGGIHSQACVITITPRPAYVEGSGGADGFVTFFENAAGRDGGAIYADDGLINWYSAEPGGHFAGRATGNTAANSGGAFYLTDTAMQFTAQWVRVEGNSAVNLGGALYASDDASFTLRGTSGMQCSYETCPAIIDSNVGSGNLNTNGGALYATSGARVNISQAVLAGNIGFAGSAILASSEGTAVTLRHVLVHRNLLTQAANLDSPISLFGGADIDMIHVSMYANLRPGGLLVVPALSSVLVSGMQTSAQIWNSVFTDDGDVAVRAFGGAGAEGECLLGHEDDSVSGMTIGDPDYQAPTSNPPDFEPSSGSDAIDRCDTIETFPMSPLPDLTGRPRPVDIPGVDGGDGDWDMGAQEAFFLVDADIFSDGFEAPLPEN